MEITLAWLTAGGKACSGGVGLGPTGCCSRQGRKSHYSNANIPRG